MGERLWSAVARLVHDGSGAEELLALCDEVDRAYDAALAECAARIREAVRELHGEELAARLRHLVAPLRPARLGDDYLMRKMADELARETDVHEVTFADGR